MQISRNTTAFLKNRPAVPACAPGAGLFAASDMKRYTALLTALLFLLCGLLQAAPSFGEPAPQPVLEWSRLDAGLELGLARLPESVETGSKAMFVVLRVAPQDHSFSLSMASESGEPLSLVEWSRRGGLRAGINASMYLPDKMTSTGYMRSGGSVNNANVGGRLGAFFVAGPDKARVPHADIIERDAAGWRERLEDYRIVVQNYRLISGGELLWPPGGPARSVAVVAKDGDGRILFILCQEPLTVERFAGVLASFSLRLGPVMYVEGGAQAGLFVRVEGDGPALPGATAHAVPGGMVHVWKGRQSLLNTRGNPDAPLPNVIGIRMQDP